MNLFLKKKSYSFFSCVLVITLSLFLFILLSLFVFYFLRRSPFRLLRLLLEVRHAQPTADEVHSLARGHVQSVRWAQSREHKVQQLLYGQRRRASVPILVKCLRDELSKVTRKREQLRHDLRGVGGYVERRAVDDVVARVDHGEDVGGVVDAEETHGGVQLLRRRFERLDGTGDGLLVLVLAQAVHKHAVRLLLRVCGDGLEDPLERLALRGDDVNDSEAVLVEDVAQEARRQLVCAVGGKDNGCVELGHRNGGVGVDGDGHRGVGVQRLDVDVLVLVVHNDVAPNVVAVDVRRKETEAALVGAGDVLGADEVLCVGVDLGTEEVLHRDNDLLECGAGVATDAWDEINSRVDDVHHAGELEARCDGDEVVVDKTFGDTREEVYDAAALDGAVGALLDAALRGINDLDGGINVVGVVGRLLLGEELQHGHDALHHFELLGHFHQVEAAVAHKLHESAQHVDLAFGSDFALVTSVLILKLLDVGRGGTLCDSSDSIFFLFPAFTAHLILQRL
eukprot:PhM_4_TR3151/c0_g1_i3/m.14706